MIKVLIAEDEHLIRGGLIALLGMEIDLEVVGEVARGDEIVARARESTPDVAVIDIDLPGKDGISAAAELRESLPSCRTLILTSLSRPRTVRRALNARVNGYMLKDSPPKKLAEAIRQVAVGGRVVDGELVMAAWESEDCPLSTREVEVLRMIADGHTIEDVVESLFLAAGTVRNYLTSATTKLDARNRVDAVRIATDRGWL